MIHTVTVPLLGLDSDNGNGSEFINAPLKAYCKVHQITFTRARPTPKNDNCYVEQKNHAMVRRRVGYFRCDTRRFRQEPSRLCEGRMPS